MGAVPRRHVVSRRVVINYPHLPSSPLSPLFPTHTSDGNGGNHLSSTVNRSKTAAATTGATADLHRSASAMAVRPRPLCTFTASTRATLDVECDPVEVCVNHGATRGGWKRNEKDGCSKQEVDVCFQLKEVVRAERASAARKPHARA